MAGSGDLYARLHLGAMSGVVRMVGSDLIGILRGHYRRDRVSGARLTCLFFTACRSPPVLLHVPRTPLDRTHSSVLSLSLPLLSFLLPLSNYSLVSSPAGRSFFEKTTRARTRPTHSHKKYRSLPIPTGDTRPHSYVFSPRLVHTLDLHLQMLFLSSYLQIPALIPCMCPIYYLFLSSPPIPPSLGFLSYSIRVDPNLYLTSHSFSLNLSSSFLALLTFSFLE
jgi:hypothetical protein